MPIGTPSPTAIDTAITPADSDARAPQITRDSRSRPTSSVPNQCAADGALRTADQLVASGSYGATQGASSASSATSTSTTAPNTAVGRASSVRSASRQGPSPASTAPPAGRASAGVLTT